MFLGWARRGFVYLPHKKEGIHPESAHGCRYHFSFSWSLFRPRASEEWFLVNSQTPLSTRVLRLEDRE